MGDVTQPQNTGSSDAIIIHCVGEFLIFQVQYHVHYYIPGQITLTMSTDALQLIELLEYVSELEFSLNLLQMIQVDGGVVVCFLPYLLAPHNPRHTMNWPAA